MRTTPRTSFEGTTRGPRRRSTPSTWAGTSGRPRRTDANGSGVRHQRRSNSAARLPADPRQGASCEACRGRCSERSVWRSCGADRRTRRPPKPYIVRASRAAIYATVCMTSKKRGRVVDLMTRVIFTAPPPRWRRRCSIGGALRGWRGVRRAATVRDRDSRTRGRCRNDVLLLEGLRGTVARSRSSRCTVATSADRRGNMKLIW